MPTSAQPLPLETIETRIKATAEKMSTVMARVLSIKGAPLEPSRVVDAMNYGSLNGGKRVRPFLVIETAALFGVPARKVENAAAAIECIHCYSLIHDDLPAMDDDDLRRGKPTTHVQFDEATAILAGDGLLTYAFELLSDPETHESADTRCKLVSVLAKAAGPLGMVGGQMLDVESETVERTDKEIRALQSMKTGALLRAACQMGAHLGGADEKQYAALTRFGEIVGLAFQLADDLLDLTADAETMGKATGKDAEAGKATLVGRHGVEAVKTELTELVDEAAKILALFGPRAEILNATAHYIAFRSN